MCCYMALTFPRFLDKLALPKSRHKIILQMPVHGQGALESHLKHPLYMGKPPTSNTHV